MWRDGREGGCELVGIAAGVRKLVGTAFVLRWDIIVGARNESWLFDVLYVVFSPISFDFYAAV